MSNLGKVAVLMGGRSAEREISLRSGNMVLAALKRKGVDAHAFDPAEHAFEQLLTQRFARVFIALHGRFGEDGTVQGALEVMGIPYTGSGVMASALAMDKWRTKLVWLASGIPTPVYEILTPDSQAADVAARLGLPLMVKPAHEGSSIGVTKVESLEKFGAAYELAARHDGSVIAEQFIAGRELTVGVLGDQVLPVGEIIPTHEIYDYECKYTAGMAREVFPADLTDAERSEVQRLALVAFRALKLRGCARIDFRMSDEGTFHCLEANTLPGMTELSLIPQAAAAAGIPFADLCERKIGRAHV